MTFEELKQANNTISTMTIKKKNIKTGKVTEKEYAEVNQRIKAYRMLFPNGTISTEILSIDNPIGVVIFKASVFDEDGRLLGTGTAFEKQDSSFINETSYIENCETSAVGRALAMCGIGIDLSVASYEEVANAMVQQDEIPKVEAEVVKDTPKKKKEETIPGYPAREVMLEVARKHYPEGSNPYKMLLESASENAGRPMEKLEDLTDNQLASVWNRFGGR